MTRQQLVAFFHVSTRTVTDAETILKQFQPFRDRVYRLGMRGTDCQGRRRSWF
ncbi:MAG TPA: hypothetical protein VKM55_17825 [Candidatus Lokiarchaeia archaeon]|nr:hypothetical protein [Candidatus Lokiarchaeia archaeon]